MNKPRGPRVGRGLAAALALLVGTAFVFDKHFENFFPLEEGRILEYSYTRKKDNNILEKAKVTVSNNPKKTWENKTVIPRKYEKVQDKGEKHVTTMFFHNDQEGVILLALQGEKDSQPKKFPHRLYYLKNPLRVGTAWGGGTDPRGSIDSLSETVTVPGGSFRDCVKVKLTYPTDLPVTEAVFWFAENVGIVKSVHVYRDGTREEFELTAAR